MDINKESFDGKWFFWSLGICDKFTKKSLEYKYRNQTNLCHFVRVTCVYVPIILLTQLLFWACAIAVAILPIHLFGFIGFMKTTGMILLAVAGVILFFATVILIQIGCEKIPELFSDTNDESKSPSIFIEWVKAKKRKICPIINFTRG